MYSYWLVETAIRWRCSAARGMKRDSNWAGKRAQDASRGGDSGEMGPWIVGGVLIIAGAAGLVGRRSKGRGGVRPSPTLWLPPSFGARPDSSNWSMHPIDSVVSGRTRLGRLAIRVVAIPVVGVGIAVLAFGYRAIAFAEPVITVGELLYSSVHGNGGGRPSVEFLPPLPPATICGLFDVAVRIGGKGERQSFIAVRDRTLNRLHGVLRILPDENGRFEAELGTYFPGGNYDLVVITPRHPSAEVALRTAEVVAGGPSPNVEGIPAPDGEFAYYAYGAKIHVPFDCAID